MITRENRKAVRIKLKNPLKVVIGSIGSDIRYQLETTDVSYTGFFLEFNDPRRFPFTDSSIMEVWLDLDSDNTIFFNGKTVRVIYSDEASLESLAPGIGIKIIQISNEEQEQLNSFVDSRRITFKEDEKKVAS